MTAVIENRKEQIGARACRMTAHSPGMKCRPESANGKEVVRARGLSSKSVSSAECA